MTQKEIINIVEKYVKDACEADATGHDWWHIERVRQNAVLINKQENANEFIVTMIALLHDLYDHKFYEGNCEVKLLKIKDLMNTDMAKIIAQERHQFLEKFLQEFLDEWEGKK